ncbi:MAG TPA: hypothetical protein VFW07_18330 [Parafilimonas sp.]|nr:hypothetical protein [Parafilimonas sp.]
MNTTVNIETLTQQLETGVDSLAKSTLQDYLTQAKTDGQAAIDEMKANLQKWTLEVESGALTADDLAFLIKEQSALDEMTALKQAGLAEVKVDEFKSNLVSMVTNTIFSFIKV